MSLRLVTPAPCFPVNTDDVISHLRLYGIYGAMQGQIEQYIAAATSEAELETYRVLVESVWDWNPSMLSVGKRIEFPIVPVTKVEVINADTDTPNQAFQVEYPSPDPMGSPLIGSILPLSGFPSNFRIILTAGYPVDTIQVDSDPCSPPVLDTVYYTENMIMLVFDRPVTGESDASKFTVINGNTNIPVEEVIFNDVVGLRVPYGMIADGDTLTLYYIGGFICDKFNNFVNPIIALDLPVVSIGGQHVDPKPFPVINKYKSKAPDIAKNYILVRAATMYLQSSELSRGSSLGNVTMMDNKFIRDSLKMIKVRFI